MTRASKYQDHYPELLLETVENGATIYSFAAKVGVGVNTIVRWRDRHEAFGAVWEQMLAKQGAAWEAMLIKLANGELPGSASAAVLHGVKTRMPDIWGDAPTKLEHSGPNGKPMQSEVLDVSKLSLEEALALKAMREKLGQPEPGKDDEPTSD